VRAPLTVPTVAPVTRSSPVLRNAEIEPTCTPAVTWTRSVGEAAHLRRDRAEIAPRSRRTKGIGA